MSKTMELIIGAISAAMFAGGIAAVPWLVRRMPEDYFVRPAPQHPLLRRIVQNIVGSMLVGLGIAMLVLPGQGILTIVIGLSVLDVPLKHRALLWLLTRKRVLSSIQQMRVRAGKPQLALPAPA